MTKMKIAAAAAALAVSPSAFAQDAVSHEEAISIVEPIYAALTASSPNDVRTQLEAATTVDWQNCALNDLCETREATIERWSGRISRVPDLRFDFKEVLVSGNKIIVRSEATGTPAGPFMGVDPHGRSFRLMTIDIHEVLGGKISRTYHVEDWSRAIRQLRGEPA